MVDGRTSSNGVASLGAPQEGECSLKALIVIQGSKPGGESLLFSRRAPLTNLNDAKLSKWCEELAATTRRELIPDSPQEQGSIERRLATPQIETAVAKLRTLADGTQKLHDVFSWLDQDKSGFIDQQELRSALQLMGSPLQDKESQSVMDFIDTDGDGRINYNEFQQAISLVPSALTQFEHWIKGLELHWLLARAIPHKDNEPMESLLAMSYPDLCAACVDISQMMAEQIWNALEEYKTMQDTASSLPTLSSERLKYKLSNEDVAGVSDSTFKFNKTLDDLVGFPDSKVLEAMKAEHCSRRDSDEEFFSSPFAIKTTPHKEWNFVIDSQESGPAERKAITLEELIEHPLVQKAHIRAEELIALRLCTGPMLEKYNLSLRSRGWDEMSTSLKGNSYITTIHLAASGIERLSRISQLGQDRKVFVGLDGPLLPDSFWKCDENGYKGGVVKGFLAGTQQMELAIQNIGFGKARPTIFELDFGQIDKGAQVEWLSQFPREAAVLFPPCSHVEVNKMGRTEMCRLGEALVIPLRLNANRNVLTFE